jgi:homoserine kinase
MLNHLDEVTVYAPATSANLAVGFDIIGFAVQHLGDVVTLKKTTDQSLQLAFISNTEENTHELEKNTLSATINSMLAYLNLKQGFSVSITKNIPLNSGMGGSAATCVAALVALNRFLKRPLVLEQLAEFALRAEQENCGSIHGNNIIPCLFGGMTLIQSLSPLVIVQLPIIPLYIVLLHPHLHLDMRDSRRVLQQHISLTDHIKQSAQLASLISSLYENNYQQLQLACADQLIEPMRAHLIPNFYDVKAAAYHSGALACSISGAGPTLFALVQTSDSAVVIAKNMGEIFKKNGIQYDSYITTISSEGARITNET